PPRAPRRRRRPRDAAARGAAGARRRSPRGAGRVTGVGPLLREGDLAVDAISAARWLLGRHLVHGEVVLRIVETEAYFWPGDTASHARAGRTERNAPLWGPPARAYVYVCYGIHLM